MKVWRVDHPDIENCDGENGPYRLDQEFDVCESMLLAHQDMDVWPDWRTDELDGETDGDWLSGFRTLRQLEEWFGDWLDLLLNEGFEIVQYEAASTRSGKSGKQIAFLPA